MGDVNVLPCRDMIDHAEYPVDRRGRPRYDDVVDHVRRELADDGCAVLPAFFTEAGLNALLSEALERKDRAYHSPRKRCNVYLGESNPDRPPDHPQNIFMERTNGFVTADLYGEDTASRRLYLWAPLRRFLADCLGKQELFIYEDPVANMIVNVGRPGEQFNWHFDTNEFTITMLLKAARSGGHFEYVPNLRSTNDECYDEVRKVLAGDRSRVRRLPLSAGDLQLFLGRFSLHRVTPNTGDSERLLLIMSFAEKPGMVGSVYRVKDLYGKVTEAHRQSERGRVRADDLLD